MAYLKASPAWYFRAQLNVYNCKILKKLREKLLLRFKQCVSKHLEC